MPGGFPDGAPATVRKVKKAQVIAQSFFANDADFQARFRHSVEALAVFPQEMAVDLEAESRAGEGCEHAVAIRYDRRDDSLAVFGGEHEVVMQA